MSNFTPTQVQHVAALANIPLKKDEIQSLADAFSETLDVIAELNAVDVSGVEPTHQVTGLENVTREDVIEEKRMFTQQQALANAPKTHNGYFVVERVIDQD